MWRSRPILPGEFASRRSTGWVGDSVGAAPSASAEGEVGATYQPVGREVRRNGSPVQPRSSGIRPNHGATAAAFTKAAGRASGWSGNGQSLLSEWRESDRITELSAETCRHGLEGRVEGLSRFPWALNAVPSERRVDSTTDCSSRKCLVMRQLGQTAPANES